MSKQLTPDGSAPKVYDTEKIIDIHSLESDPSFDSKKVRQVKSYTPHLKYTNNSNYISDKNDSNITNSKRKYTLENPTEQNANDDIDLYDYRGKLY